ncbi:MAG: respiratory nitrate reductase subunit gamma [Thermoanaerobaculia bacterium]
MTRDLFLYGLFPYLAVALLAGGTAWRLIAAGRRGGVQAARERSAPLYHGSVAWRWGLALALLGHAGAFLTPRWLLLWDRMPLRRILLEATGFTLGAMALTGLLLLIWETRGRRPLADFLLVLLLATSLVSGLLSAALYRWGSSWYAVSLLPWFQSLAGLSPDVSLVAGLPWPVRLHVLSGLAAAAVLPFTRGVYALAGAVLDLPRKLAALRASRWAMAGVEAGLALLTVIFLVGAFQRVGVSQGYEPAQPIAFSHRIHAGDYHIACQYCHFAAEKSRHAGIPPESVCMNCHGKLKVTSAEMEKLKEAVSQRRAIRWARIHQLPDFVFFSHSQHVRGGRVACQRCHGPVETMERVRQEEPLVMGWCLDCHRREGVAPAAQRGGRQLHPAIGGLDCGKCHY